MYEDPTHITMLNPLTLAILIALFGLCSSFDPVKFRSQVRRSGSLNMEYIPDGLTKAQWDAMKKKEADELKGKNLGAIGITKFKSRSFEAFQKSGGKNLFPVDPSTPLEERPYMQRPGGMPDGSDLKKKGLFGRGQGAGSKRSSIDDKYDGLEKAGKLASAPWAANLPWSNAAAEKYKTPLAKKKEEERIASAAKSKRSPKPPSNRGKASKSTATEEASSKKRGGFWGLF